MLAFINLIFLELLFSEALVAIIITPISGIVLVTVLAMTQHHRRKMAELKLKEQKGVSDDVRAEIDGLKQEMKNLRDVTTQYDLSFDTTLQQVERRVSQLETARYTNTSDSAQQSQHLGGGRQN